MKLKIQGARLSFPDLFEATQYQGTGPSNYRAQLLVPGDGSGDAKACIAMSTNPDGTTVWGAWGPAKKVIDEAVAQVAKEKWGAKAQQILNANEGNPQKTCWIDGAKRTYDGYAGNWALTTTRAQEKGRPLVMDANKQPLVVGDGKPYAGCYVNASVELWPQDNGHGKAVRCQLNGVQFLRDGDAFSAGGPADPNDFEALAEGAQAEDLA